MAVRIAELNPHYFKWNFVNYSLNCEDFPSWVEQKICVFDADNCGSCTSYWVEVCDNFTQYWRVYHEWYLAEYDYGLEVENEFYISRCDKDAISSEAKECLKYVV